MNCLIILYPISQYDAQIKTPWAFETPNQQAGHASPTATHGAKMPQIIKNLLQTSLRHLETPQAPIKAFHDSEQVSLGVALTVVL
jgi:hypothetical protein